MAFVPCDSTAGTVGFAFSLTPEYITQTLPGKWKRLPGEQIAITGQKPINTRVLPALRPLKNHCIALAMH